MPTLENDAGNSVDAGSTAPSADSGSEGPIDAGPQSPVDAGTVAPTGAITAAADSWVWVDFPESKCASGTPTGIGVNLHPGSNKVVFFFEGGGACSTAANCWGPTPQAANLAGYGADLFNAPAPQTKFPIFSRTAANPFKEMNYVFVPYCTGDMHAGTTETDLMVNGAVKPTYFWGAKDLDLFLARLGPTFPHAEHIWVTGGSAGGFATVLDYDHITRTFPGVRVDIIDDSGPSIVSKGASDNAGLFKAWNVVPPAGCTGCNSHADLLAFDRHSQPNSRYAFMSYDRDTSISRDFGYTLDEYPAVLQKFFTDSLAGDPQAATFVVTNKDSHVVESDPINATQYLPWLTQMVNDDPAWASKTYLHP